MPPPDANRTGPARYAPAPMKATLAIAVAVTLVLAACGESDVRPAAVVNGTEIAQQDLADDLDAIESNEDFLAAQERAGRPVRGETSGTFDTAFAASVLNRRIQNLLVHQEVLDRDIDVTDECRDAAREAVLNRLGGDDPDAGEAILDAFPEPFRSSFVVAEADVLALQGDLAGLGCVKEDAAEEFFDDNPDDFAQACLSIINVATQDEADAIAEGLATGGDFAALADANATGGTGPGGDVGCVVRSEFGPALPALTDVVFAAVPGQVVGPVPGGAGFVFAQVREVREPDFDDEATQAQVEEAVAAAAEEAFGVWSQEALTEAEIEVDERYGRWDPATGQLLAPDVPSPSEDTDGPGPEGGDPATGTPAAPPPSQTG